MLKAKVLHADERLVAMLDPGAGKTHKAYVWAYARGAFDATPAVVYNFSTGRAARQPIEFLGRWSGTLTCDDYAGYNAVFKLHVSSRRNQATSESAYSGHPGVASGASESAYTGHGVIGIYRPVQSRHKPATA